MKRSLAIFIALVALCVAVYSFAYQWDQNHQGNSEKIRPALVAGLFYPDDPAQLGFAVDTFLAAVQPAKQDGALFALLAPHAGYLFSGQVAAHAYALLKKHHFERVVVIAPSHFESFPYSAIYDGDAYTTPLGQIPVDKAFAARLAEKSPLLRLSDSGHRMVQGRGEHAIEDELPFLQRTLGAFKLVPIIMGEQNYDIERALGLALADSIKAQGAARDPDTLIVVSSDLSHYHTYDQAVQRDRKVLDAIAEGDHFSLSKNFERGIWEACGGGPIVSAMIAANRLGANNNVILNYANTGDVTGDKSHVVGYASAAFLRTEAQSASPTKTFSLALQEKDALLAIAKKSVETAVRQQKLYDLPQSLPKAFEPARGAFVTLREHGLLRGCIGFTTPTKSLAETVRDVAAFAAAHDARFSPVTPDELGRLDYEISVLSPLRPIKDVQEIRMGTDGLLLREGEAEGLFLPQVPAEQGWDRTTFLEKLGVKAGLSTNAWQDSNADLFAFTAFVFGDEAR
jgi:hypothetical protein